MISTPVYNGGVGLSMLDAASSASRHNVTKRLFLTGRQDAARWLYQLRSACTVNLTYPSWPLARRPSPAGARPAPRATRGPAPLSAAPT